MELPEAVVNYIKAFKDPSRQEKREIELFNSFDELSCKKINVNIAKNKQQGTSKTSREPNRHNVFKKRTIDRIVIPKLNNSVNTEHSTLNISHQALNTSHQAPPLFRHRS